MNFGEPSGESSSGGQENGVAPSDAERPLKKARFPWQVKGKHHLKNQLPELTESSTKASTEPEAEPPSAESVTPPTNSIVPSTRSKLRNVNTYTFASDGDMESSTRLRLLGHGPPLPLETVISLAETMLLNAEKEGIKVIRRDIIQTKPKVDPNAGSSKTFTARELRRMKHAEEKCIARWQAAQTVKGCFDNTINRVLESWMTAAAPPEDRFLALDFARIMNELPPSDDNIENEGILMAINAHGLQNVAGAPAGRAFPSLIGPSSALAAQLACDIPIYDDDSDSSLCSEEYEILKNARHMCSPWPSEEPNPLDSNEDPPDTNDDRSVVRPDCNHPSTPEEDNNNEYEFMNSAVIQAIKSKGLMAAGTDFG